MSDEKNTDELTDLFDSTGLSEEDEALAAEFANCCHWMTTMKRSARARRMLLKVIPRQRI